MRTAESAQQKGEEICREIRQEKPAASILQELLEKIGQNGQTIFLCDEIGSGIVPVDPLEKSTFIAEELAHPEHLNEIIERLRIDVAAADATISQRKRWHNIHQLLADVEALQHIPLDFKASTPYPPVEKRFITQDEIDAALSNGNSFSSGKARIYQFFTQGHTREEQISFLRNEYGIGGRSHALSGADYSWVEYDAKGLVYKRGALTDIYDSVTLKWSQAAKRIGELIQADRFITLEPVLKPSN